jgi:hypothetical protein
MTRIPGRVNPQFWPRMHTNAHKYDSDVLFSCIRAHPRAGAESDFGWTPSITRVTGRVNPQFWPRMHTNVREYDFEVLSVFIRVHLWLIPFCLSEPGLRDIR